jgi:hypothetical protein
MQPVFYNPLFFINPAFYIWPDLASIYKCQVTYKSQVTTYKSQVTTYKSQVTARLPDHRMQICLNRIAVEGVSCVYKEVNSTFLAWKGIEFSDGKLLESRLLDYLYPSTK